MAQEIQGKVGPIVASDGTLQDFRLAKDGSQAVQDSHAKFQEAVYRGRVWTVTVGAAGVAPGTALGTAPPLTIFNPVGSGVNLILWKAHMGYISGTLGAGNIVWAYNIQTTLVAPTGGTALTPNNNLVGVATSGQAKAFTGSTVSTSQTLFRPTGVSLGAALATTATFAASPVYEPVEGELVVIPGACLSLQGIAAAGTTPLMVFSMTYEEAPI